MAPLARSGPRDHRDSRNNRDLDLNFDRDPRDFEDMPRQSNGNYDGRGSDDGRGERGASSRGGGSGNYRSFAADVSSGRRNRDDI